MSKQIQEKYWEFVLENGKPPASVFKFCRELGIKESEFFNEFSHFDAVEGVFWKELITSTVTVLESDEDYQNYDGRQRLLAFYYTFFELLLDNRSRFLARFPKHALCSESLSGMKKAFQEHAEGLIQHSLNTGELTGNSKQAPFLVNLLSGQFLFLLDFNRKDQSHGFEDTDALIEKSVRFFYESLHLPGIEAGFDLVKFLLPRFRS